MNDVSVLLNLTAKVVFDSSHPLMDLVSGHGPYVFYDQISLERFPMERDEQLGHAERLLTKLRNLLENRRLSFDDQGGGIRLCILMDIEDSFLHPSEQKYCFPAQKVHRFRKLVDEVFKNNIQLTKRFTYTFIFLEDIDSGKDLAAFYRALAYDGCLGQSQVWMSSEDLDVNSLRDRFLEDLKAPSEDWELRDSRVEKRFARFRQELKQRIDVLADFLVQAGADEDFRKKVTDVVDALKTIGDIRDLDFNALFTNTVSSLIGLQHASDEDSAFVIFKQKTLTEALRRTDELVLVALLQLFGTAEDQAFRKLLGIQAQTPPKLFVVDAQQNKSSLNVEALVQLRQTIVKSQRFLGEDGSLRWTEKKSVIFNEYSAKNTEPLELDEHKELNDQISEEREALLSRFEALRKIPFFFGRRSGDWTWYNQVVEVLDEIHDFELKHDRPLYGSLRRITEKKMNSKGIKDTYTGLKLRLGTLEKEQPTGTSLAELKDYLKEREMAMKTYIEWMQKAKSEMVKLGIASTTYRIAIFAALIVVAAFALHFCLRGNADSPWWIGAGLVAVCLFTILGCMIAQSRIKSGITKAFNQLFLILTVQLQDKQELYRKSINERISKQNEADIRKKNIDELREKWNELERHNMQVDLWYRHFSKMLEHIDQMLVYLGKSASDTVETDVQIVDTDFQFDEIPALPLSATEHFRRMSVHLSTGIQCQGVTCFLKYLYLTDFAKKDY